MRELVARAVRTWREEGFVTMLLRVGEFLHDTAIRPHLPRRCATYNGIETRGARALDWLVPWETVDKPTYESAILNALREHVRAGDHVVIVGGGWGVSATVVAERVGPDGYVIVYEGSASGVDYVRETATMNGVTDRIEVRHAIVGESISLLNDAGKVETVPTDDLPECDVLVLDCEGAELTILEALPSRPRVLVVESHGFLDAPPEAVRKRIVTLDYAVTSVEPANSGQVGYCEKNGIHVFVAE